MAAYGLYKRYMKEELLPIYNSLSFGTKQEGEEDHVMTNLLREDVVKDMCDLGHTGCQNNVLEIFKAWMEVSDPDKNNEIPPSLRKATYCTAIKTGNEVEWDFLWLRYKKTSNVNEKRNILYALGCSQQVWILKVRTTEFTTLEALNTY